MVGEFLDLVHRVRGEDDADAVGAQPAHELADSEAGGGVEAGRRLVQEREPGAADERRRERDPHPLPPGQPAQGGAQAVGQAPGRDQRRERERLGVQPRDVGEKPACSRGGGQAPVLQHHPDVRAQLGPVRTLARVETQHPDVAGVRAPQPSQISTAVVLPAPFGPRRR